jgi:hypothetical protein
MTKLYTAPERDVNHEPEGSFPQKVQVFLSEAGHAQFLDEARVVDALAAGGSMAVGCPPRADRMCVPRSGL